MSRLVATIASTLLVVASLAVSAVAVELGFRAYSGVPVLRWADYRFERARQNAIDASEYDPLLGWRMRSNLSAPPGASSRFSTSDDGIRNNREPGGPPPTGGILAVGDSFTAGSEVSDAETWPAYLEGLLGEPVLNAGVGGFGVDQAMLRAEQLIGKYRPKMVLFGILEQDILRVGFNRYGKPKPFFTAENDALRLHNSPVPIDTASPSEQPLWKRLAGHSYAIDRVMARLRPQTWIAGLSHGYEKINVDEVEISCGVLGRLAARAAEARIPVVVVMQYGASVTASKAGRPGYAELVLDCARELNMPVVDEFDTMRAIVAQGGPAALRDHYVVQPDNVTLGHMSARGNRLIASLIAPVVREVEANPPPPGRPDGRSAREGTVPPAAKAVVLDPIGTSHARVAPVAGGTMTPSFRVESTRATEHYIVAAQSLPVEPGQQTFSILARPGGTGKVRLVMVDETSTGILADFDLVGGDVIQKVRLGSTRIARARSEPVPGGWRRLELTAILRGRKATATIQLLDDEGGTVFEGHDTGIIMARPLLGPNPRAVADATPAD